MKLPGLRLVSVLALALGASACLDVPKASVEDDARAKMFGTRSDQCGLYVYRNESSAGNVALPLDIDGVELGATGPHTYLFTWLTSGKHTLSSHTDENVRVQIVAKPGTLIYVRQESEMGFLHFDSKLQLVNEAEGQDGVRKCSLTEIEQ
jgi:hypothetical protein